MGKLLRTILCAVLYGSLVASIPVRDASTLGGEAATATASSNASKPSPTVPYAGDDPNYSLWNETTTTDPEPERGSLGANILGPQNTPMDVQNPDMLAPPTTDQGTVGNAKWPFSLSKNQLNTGGWVRQQNVQQMPMAKAMAGVNMRLEAGAIRELHWHQTAEWAYVLNGSTQITSVDGLGRNYIATVNKGDLWYFPPGIPHSLQATADSPEGSEFLLIFPDGTFNDDDTLLLTDWLAHTPKEVIAKNFQDDMSEWDKIPGGQLYIFPGDPPADDQKSPVSPAGAVPQPFSHAFSQVAPTRYAGGTVKIADSRTFEVATQIAVAEITVEPGAMREMHWHPTHDEWGFFLEGNARVTLFAGTSVAQTFDYQPGDISYVPAGFGHYVENTGRTTLKFLEIFNTDVFQDVSLAQWLALTPPALVKQHLGLSDGALAKLAGAREKRVIVGGPSKPSPPS